MVLIDRSKEAVIVIASDIALDAPPGNPGITPTAALALAQGLVDDLPEPPD
ncbi:hypothetical protein D3C71_2185920 [compost metagenome]